MFYHYTRSYYNIQKNNGFYIFYSLNKKIVTLELIYIYIYTNYNVVFS
jgi:hypothetical protein